MSVRGCGSVSQAWLLLFGVLVSESPEGHWGGEQGSDFVWFGVVGIPSLRLVRSAPTAYTCEKQVRKGGGGAYNDE